MRPSVVGIRGEYFWMVSRSKEVMDEKRDCPSTFRPTGNGDLFDGIGGKWRKERSIGEEGATRFERENGISGASEGGDSGFQSIARSERFSFRDLRFVLGSLIDGVGGSD